jgi:hypothetical protein
VTQEKILQYVGLKFGEDIANKLKKKTTMALTPPKYSYAIELRHGEYQKLVRKKQTTHMTALKTKLTTLQSTASAGQDVTLEIANLQNKIDDLEFESRQKVPHKLTAEEAASYYNNAKTHSLRKDTLEKHCGQVYALIYG